MHAVTNRIRRVGKPVEIAVGDRLRERCQLARPALRVDIACVRELRRELQKPCPAVAALEGAAFRPAKIRDFRSYVRRRKVRVERPADQRRFGDVCLQPEDARKQPMRVHAGMPVEAAEERRMEHARRRDIRRAGHDVIELVRELALDVREREAGKCRRLRRGQQLIGGFLPTRMSTTGRKGPDWHRNLKRTYFRRLRGSPSCARARPSAACGCGSISA